MKNFNLPVLGAGAGLRHEHFEDIIEKKLPFKWFEIISDDFFHIGGAVGEAFDRIRLQYPIVPHGVGLSIGSTDPLDFEYLKKVKSLVRTLNAPWVSEHLCFTMVDHTNLEDLIPLPFTTEAVNNVVERARIVQDFVEVPLLLENVTRYITVSNREMQEWEFITSILEQADVGLLLDVTNVYLNSQFHSFDPEEFMKSLPLERVGQIHLAGWDTSDEQIIDSHDAPVPPEVWQLFQSTIKKIGPTSVIVEWDKSLPSAARLLDEAQMADAVMYSSQEAA